jgi:hypothetical protein
MIRPENPNCVFEAVSDFDAIPLLYFSPCVVKVRRCQLVTDIRDDESLIFEKYAQNA